MFILIFDPSYGFWVVFATGEGTGSPTVGQALVQSLCTV